MQQLLVALSDGRPLSEPSTMPMLMVTGTTVAGAAAATATNGLAFDWGWSGACPTTRGEARMQRTSSPRMRSLLPLKGGRAP